MYDKTSLNKASRRITEVREGLVQRYPFFGKLILRMKVKFAQCGTACTDMESIIFDLDFMQELNDAQLGFVMLHEVLHCVFKHCIRGKGRIPLIYNIACDIVVNSFILDTLGLKEFNICGEAVMHIAPDGSEGRTTTAEQVYEMLIQLKDLQELDKLYRKGTFDNHDGWDDLDAQLLSEQWDKYIRDTAGMIGGKGHNGIPGGIRRYLKDVSHTPKTNWRQLLQDYIRFDRYDYDFTTPDRRFQDDYLMPSFRENVFGDTVKGLWLFVDASGSVSDTELAVLMKEIYSAYEQIENISGKISFFDSVISDPISFESFDELSIAKPIGGGGTSFKGIFEYLDSVEDELPDLILIFTDGYAEFPEESVSLGIPVVWLIIDSDNEPPWGNTVYIFTEERMSDT